MRGFFPEPEALHPCLLLRRVRKTVVRPQLRRVLWFVIQLAAASCSLSRFFSCVLLSAARKAASANNRILEASPWLPATPTAAPPERRVALVIGNAAYQYTTPLVNPVNDAQDIARVLTDLQFQVILKTNATLDTMADAIFTFGERLKGGGSRAALLFRAWPAGKR